MEEVEVVIATFKLTLHKTEQIGMRTFPNALLLEIMA